MTTEQTVDVQVEGANGASSVFLFLPLTEAAQEWIDENVSDESTWFGGGLVVENRYAGELAQGMVGDGLVVR